MVRRVGIVSFLGVYVHVGISTAPFFNDLPRQHGGRKSIIFCFYLQRNVVITVLYPNGT